MCKITDRYTSKNGYTGVLYGKASFSIYDKNGKEIMHTGSRAFNSHNELIKMVEDFPKLFEELEKKWDEICKDTDNEEDNI